ncbi:hypothetical protein Taro_024155 [Colocasia esculenta]|uniref:Retrotransposon gag domain-containing protein n=1 Tax=Colocasia esculenta TaxID=4460 RepID=A0A843VAH5_COLES|nr:hypothetical protein [Colocasia esculenta]
MASRGRRGGAPARKGEPRRDEQAEQQAPAPQGPVLPPPPPVDYGVFMQGLKRADVWWASLLRTRFEDGAIEVAWDEFVRLFRAKFVPEHIQDRMEQEFLSLTQGSMTMLEYEARFAELSKYAPYIVANEHRKAKKFVMGLKPSLRTRLVAFDHRTLDEAPALLVGRRVRWSNILRRRRLRRRGLQLRSSGRTRRKQCTRYRSVQ